MRDRHSTRGDACHAAFVDGERPYSPISFAT